MRLLCCLVLLGFFMAGSAAGRRLQQQQPTNSDSSSVSDTYTGQIAPLALKMRSGGVSSPSPSPAAPPGPDQRSPPPADSSLAAAVKRRGPVAEACQAAGPYTRYVRVSKTAGLLKALNKARAGDLIELMPGTYDRAPLTNVTILGKTGTPTRRITVCGAETSIVTAAGDYVNWPYVFLVRHSNYITLTGFTVTTGFKGVVVEGSSNIVLNKLRVSEIGYDGVRVRFNSSDVTIQGCEITNTGRMERGLGEGIYVGSSHNAVYDKTTSTQILNNHVGPGVTAEMIDIKENSEGGLIEGNYFDGSDLSGDNYADSWVDIKGSGFMVRNNTGFNTLVDGFQTHNQDVPNSGELNNFENNTCNMGSGTGLCIGMRCDCHTNTVACNNVVIGGSMQMTNRNLVC